MVRIFVFLVLLLAGCVTRTLAPVVDRGPGVPAPADVAVPPLSAPPQALPLPPTAPEKEWRPEFYTVKRGETLYTIALEHGLDYRELAAMNYIDNANVIRDGQVLRLRPPGETSAPGPGPMSAPLVSVPPVDDARAVLPESPPAERGNTDTYKAQPKAIKLPYSEAALAQLQAPTPKQVSSSPTGPAAAAANTPPAANVPSVARIAAVPAAPPPSLPLRPPAAADAGDDPVDWGWPARGKIISAYSETASLKGIDIGGAAGVPIVASAAGRVVYAGSGLRGYGKLVIVKHNKIYLSAYAHLDRISIREGQNVTKGQELGKMGNTDADQVKLHFEIRALGKPVDPLRYLPRG